MEKMQNMQWILQLCCMDSLIYNVKPIRDLIFRVADRELYTVKSHQCKRHFIVITMASLCIRF